MCEKCEKALERLIASNVRYQNLIKRLHGRE